MAVVDFYDRDKIPNNLNILPGVDAVPEISVGRDRSGDWKREEIHMSLRTKLVRAGVWTVAAYSIELVTKLLSNLLLTRLLFPEAFGLVAASSSILIGLTLISDLGIRAVIIQSPRGETVSFLHSAWVFQVCRGIILWVILIVCCGILAIPFVRDFIPPESVFSNRAFPFLTAVLGFGLVLNGLESTTIALNLRRLNYKSIILVDLVGRIIPAPIMVGCALFFSSVWVLAGGALIGGLLRLVLSHVAVPGPQMSWKYQKSHFREIVHFGKWITISSIASFVGSQSDVILFGLIFPSSFVGVYFIARSLVDAAEGLLERLNSSLTLPALGEVLRQNPQNLRDRFYRFRYPIDVIAAGLGGFLCVTGSQIVNFLYDARYSEAGPILELLGLGLALYPLQLIRGAFTAIGKTHTVAMVSVVQAGAMVASLLLGFFTFGALGAVAGVALSRLVPSVLIIVLARRHNWVGLLKELRIVPLFLLGLFVGGSTNLLLRSFGLDRLH
jgi:O-antigen/teichoic acid export membrane protein